MLAIDNWFQLVSDDIRGVWVSASMGASTYSHYTTPNSPEPDAINGCDRRAPPHLACSLIPAAGHQAGDTYAAARSQHVGGVYAARVDGSCQFYADDIDSTIWM